MTMTTCHLSDLTVDRVVVRNASSTKARVIKAGAALKLFLACHASTRLFWHESYKCWYAKPTKTIGTLMVFPF
jgi:hypothetical protein